MGHTDHRALVVSSQIEKDGLHWAELAHRAAHDEFEVEDLEGLITPLVDGTINGVRSFAILSCGSQTGWPDEFVFLIALGNFKQWLREQRYEDGSSPLHWVDVMYGDTFPHVEAAGGRRW